MKNVNHFLTSLPTNLLTLKPAFTLAETLITLGIIGVVAAITIPGLINNFKAHQLRSRLLKSYSTIQQAAKRMEGDDISLDVNSYGSGGSFVKTFAKYLTGTTNCNSSNANCGINVSKYPIKSILDDGILLLNDGTLFLFENPPGSTNRVYITVDLNGYYKKPNRFGHDLFTFQLVDGQFKAMGQLGTQYTLCNFKGNDDSRVGCTNKAISNTDYFIKAIKDIK